MRRGRPSVYSLFGSRISVLVGDYVLTNALISSITTQRIDLMEEVFRAARWLVDGELFQLYNISVDEFSEKNYYNIIKKKTAVLFSSCAKSGAMTTTENPHDIKNMEDFGMIIGKCFQIKDDIFDYIAGDEIGKPRGNDMIEGKLTLPVIHALLSTNNEQMISIAKKVKAGEASRGEIDQLVRFTIDNHGIEYSYQIMEQYALQARTILSDYPDSPVKTALYHYIDYVVCRDH
jgi:octaprenyl-diphosphate synthase